MTFCTPPFFLAGQLDCNSPGRTCTFYCTRKSGCPPRFSTTDTKNITSAPKKFCLLLYLAIFSVSHVEPGDTRAAFLLGLYLATIALAAHRGVVGQNDSLGRLNKLFMSGVYKNKIDF